MRGTVCKLPGKNYLVPVDAELSTAEALEFEMVQLDVVHRIMERADEHEHPVPGRLPQQSAVAQSRQGHGHAVRRDRARPRHRSNLASAR